MIVSGSILKMKSTLAEVVEYKLPIGDELLLMNQFLEKKIILEFSGDINCIHSGKKIKKSYGQGYSYESFMKLAACDMCIVKPELCHFDKGTCREPEWGRANCFAPHVIYLSDTSSIKVGITRKSQVPTRWIDQGATRAIPLVEVDNRMISGQVEVELKSMFNDKTNWRKMLQNESESVFWNEEYNKALDFLPNELKPYITRHDKILISEFKFPVDKYPTKVKSLNLSKTPNYEGKLTGIKGQYLIFDDQTVFNIRSNEGQKIKLIISN